ncbi:beta-lactamase family protein [Bradyrhizobium tropiciagri]|uniref:serine hydrolase domain-containing protein n=1 Tax=Bradyrhizobium tropiciagri TaxID=312253 RepID=UPI001BA9E812|nr:serine hydrolase domain-containing protein [Bradyrhizobium tropiciagri]MBR0873485.1 beta-lactamase family protein [Bradyrhizobium tropiciagri]
MPPERLRKAGQAMSRIFWDALFVLLLIILACLMAAAFVPAIAAPMPPPADVVASLEKIIRQDAIRGVTLIVFRHGQQLYRVDAGDIDPDAHFPVASASKWVAAALVMTVVDEGKLSLDEPIGARLPNFTGTAGKITLRQLLSYTSGQGGLRGLADIRQDPRISLADSASAIARLPLQDAPGTVFRYGGPAFQVAGALVEQATGESWTKLFEARIARPLRMEHTSWGNPLWPELSTAEIRNPNLQGGLVTTAADYGKFLTMLAAGGRYEGKRILSEQAIAEMERAQTLGARIAVQAIGTRRRLQYALGNWCEAMRRDRTCDVASSPGAFGTYPWIDRRHDLYGLFFMRDRLPNVEREIQATRRVILQADAGAHP